MYTIIEKLEQIKKIKIKSISKQDKMNSDVL